MAIIEERVVEVLRNVMRRPKSEARAVQAMNHVFARQKYDALHGVKAEFPIK